MTTKPKFKVVLVSTPRLQPCIKVSASDQTTMRQFDGGHAGGACFACAYGDRTHSRAKRMSIAGLLPGT